MTHENASIKFLIRVYFPDASDAHKVSSEVFEAVDYQIRQRRVDIITRKGSFMFPLHAILRMDIETFMPTMP